MSYVDNHLCSFFRFFFAVTVDGGRAQPFVRVDNLYLRTRGMIMNYLSRSVYRVRHTRGSYIVYAWLSLALATPENKAIPLDDTTYMQVRLKSGF